MGLFGTQTKQEPVSPPPFDEEPFDELPTLPKPQNTTVIAKGIKFTGVIRGEGNVQVEGQLEGEIDLIGGVTVASGGVVQGPVTADAVRVAGDLTGSVTAREHLCLERTGSIHGDVATASLMVENGRLDGSSTMLAPAAPREGEVSSADLSFESDYNLNTEI